jgi:hypothetical protein
MSEEKTQPTLAQRAVRKSTITRVVRVTLCSPLLVYAPVQNSLWERARLCCRDALYTLDTTTNTDNCSARVDLYIFSNTVPFLRFPHSSNLLASGADPLPL